MRIDLVTEKHENVRSVYVAFNLSISYNIIKPRCIFEGPKPSYPSNAEEKKPKHLCLLIKKPFLRYSNMYHSTDIYYGLCVRKSKEEIGN